MALCRALDGEDVPLPFAYWLGRLCEEFNCLPSAAYREWLTVPAGLLEEIIEGRAFARAKDTFDHARTKSEVPRTPMVRRVIDIEFAIALEDRARER